MTVRRKQTCFLLFVIAALAALVFSPTAGAWIGEGGGGGGATAPWIVSDKADYPPGGHVALSGGGWQPGESVHISVNDDAGQTWSRNVDVTADGTGAIGDEFDLPGWFVAVYSVTATGERSGTATTTFTDGNVTFLRGSNTPTSFTVNYTDHGNTSCTGTGTAGSRAFTASDTQRTVGVGNNSSVKLGSVTTPPGFVFDRWTRDSATGPTVANNSCWTAPGGNVVDLYAHFKLVNTPPAASVPVYTPVAPKTDDVLTASTTTSDAEGNNVSVAWVWKLTRAGNTCTIATATSAAAAPGSRTVSLNLASSYAASACSGSALGSVNPSKGDTIMVEATPNDGVVNGTTRTGSVTIANSAPAATVALSTPAPKTNDTMNATATRADADGDAVSVRYVWKVNGAVLRDVTKSSGTSSDLSDQFDLSLAGNGDEGDAIRIEVTPNDGIASGTTVADTATVANSAPSATSLSVSTDEDTARTITLAGLDADADSLAFTLTSVPGGGKLYAGASTSGTEITSAMLPYSLSGSQLTYDPDPNLHGADSFDFRVSDGQLESGPATVSITVNPVNDAPVAKDDQGFEADEDTALLIDPDDLLANDADVDGDALSLASVAGASNGAVAIVEEGADAGMIRFLPAPDYHGPASFTYKASDGQLESGAASVAIAVSPVNDDPTVAADVDAVTVDEGATAENGGSFGDVDGDAVELTASVGTVSRNASGTWRWSFPTTNGPDQSQTVRITAEDSAGATAVASFDLSVRNVAPSATFDAPAAVDEGSEIELSLSAVVDPGTEDAHEFRFRCGAGAWSAYGASSTHACGTSDDG
ncbi:MAG: cadherin-like domain-containing protein, partial [Actinomycetota bacterium]|nr:cadherin-like domain-containing protein [Actinomycetota bacterium]